MGLDDRDYMNTPEGRDPKDVWYRPKEHRSGQSNAEFWSKVQRGNSGRRIGWILGGLAIGGFACYMYVTGLDPGMALDSLVGRVKAAIASGQQRIRLGRTDSGSEALTRARCVSAEAPQRMTRRFGHGEVMPTGRYFEFVNGTRSQLFIRVSSGIDGAITETLLLAPGDVVIEPALSPHARLELQTGRRWCNDSDGWEDAQVTRVQGTIAAIEGTTKVAFASNSDGGIGVSVLTQAIGMPMAMAAPNGTEQQLARVGPAIKPQAEEQLQGLGQGDGRRSVLQRSQSDQQVAERQQSTLLSRPDGVMEKHMATLAEETESEAALRQGVRVQDWRDVPARDIRMVTNGSMHYVGGQVGEEDVQFQLHLEGTSMIGEELAKRVGASSCRGGHWLVLDRYWVSCKKLVSRVSFGSVTLENVLIAVVPGEVTPVLSSDLVGRATIFRGRDGDYLAVGR